MYLYEKERLRKERLRKSQVRKDEELLGALAPAPPPPQKQYVSLMSSMSHTYGNVLAWFQRYILDFFPENTFKTIHVNSKIAHRQIRETNHEFLKKTKPMIIFRPRIADMGEDRFLRGTPLIERQNDIYSTWGGTALQPFFEDHNHDLVIKYQQNRSVMNIDVALMFSTLMNQIDYVHYLQNAIAWNKDNFVPTALENYLPQEMLKIIGDISGVPLYDESGSTYTFMQYMNQNSDQPVTYKLEGSTGNKEFYRYYHSNINTFFQDLSWDDGEKVGHIMDYYQITFSVRLEFWTTGFYYVFSDRIFDIGLPDRSDLLSDGVIPVFTDVIAKEDLCLQPGWHIYNKASCRLEKIKDTVNISELFNASIKAAIRYHKDNGIPLQEFLDIKVRRQGFMLRENIDYHINYDTFDVQFNNRGTYFTYRFIICVNVEYINDLVKKIFNLG